MYGRIDDIEDSSEFRRNHQCAHIKFGIPLTLNSANLAYFEALKLVQTLNIPGLSELFTGKLAQEKNKCEFKDETVDEMINLHFGQGSEIYYRDNGISPSIDEYYRICAMKTGGLFRLSVKLLIKCTKKRIDTDTMNLMIKLAEELGKLYQVRDDYMNIFEGTADDLIEGKFTLPTIFADLKTVKCETSESIKEIKSKLYFCEADKFCLRIMSEMAVELEDFIFEIERNLDRRNNLKEIIYSLIEFKQL